MKLVSLAAAALIALSGAAMADPVLGTWKTQTGETGGHLLVKMEKCGSKICGSIAKVVNNNNQSITGKKMIWNMNADGGGSYSGGRIWAPDVDKDYKAKMKLLNANSLRVQGCAGVCTALTSRKQTWSRVN